MKKTELVSIAIVIISLVVKFTILPNSWILFILSFLLIPVIYMHFGFALFNNLRFRDIFIAENFKGISRKRIIGAVGAGLALSISIMGIMEKVLSWQGASVFLVIGLLVVTVISLIKIENSADKYYYNILKRVGIYGAICLFLIAIPNKTMLNWKYPDNPEYVNAILEAKAKPNQPELWDVVDEGFQKMRNQQKLK
jgi:hypothetical protein